MKFAAVDIGSNAVRLQISKLITENGQNPRFKKIEYIRFPLRMGEEVFVKRYISKAYQKKIEALFTAIKLLLKIFEVDHYKIIATSAFREAQNGEEVMQKLRQLTGLKIYIISGLEEAKLLENVISPLLVSPYTLHIEVGGGSTELTFYHYTEKIDVASFEIGSVRLLLTPSALEYEWLRMKNWLYERKKNISKKLDGIATGGNIRKLLSLAKKKHEGILSLKRLHLLEESLSSYSYEERQKVYNLHEDRADVIVTAAQIYIQVMEWSGVLRITVPEVGLKNGILKSVFLDFKNKN